MRGPVAEKPMPVSASEAAEARLELERRRRDSRLLFYKPPCRAHVEWRGKTAVIACPRIPCPESRHTAFHLSEKRIRVIFGGNRSIKTTTAIIELLLMACFKTHPFRKTTNPVNGKWRVYSSDFGIIEKLILPMIKDWIPRESLWKDGATKEEAWENSYDTKFHILRLKNSVIDFMSYDQDPSKSESVDLDGVVADEEMPEGIYAACLARLVSRDGRFWMAVTPLYDLTWAMQFLDSTDEQIEVFRYEIYDNPYLPEKVIRDFEASVPEHEKEARIYGRFLELQGLVYKELRTDIHLIQPDKDLKSYPVIFALDPHPRKPSVMTWAYVTPKDDVVFFDELEMAGSARDIAYAIRAKESHHKGKTMLRLIDPAAKAQASSMGFETDTLREFEKEGMSFTLADNSEAGYNVVHEYLTYNNALPLSSMNRPRCFFTRDVQKTWHGMTHLLWDDWTFKRTIRDKKEIVKDFKKDFPDTVRYILSSRPTYRSAGAFVRAEPIGNIIRQQTHKPADASFRELVLGNRR